MQSGCSEKFHLSFVYLHCNKLQVMVIYICTSQEIMATSVTRKELLSLYRQLLRSCETYPSKNRARIYQSIREDFRDNKNLEPGSDKTRKQIHVAFKGLEQLHQFDGRNSPSFSVQLEQNPFPKPDDYEDKRTKRAQEMMKEQETK